MTGSPRSSPSGSKKAVSSTTPSSSHHRSTPLPHSTTPETSHTSQSLHHHLQQHLLKKKKTEKDKDKDKDKHHHATATTTSHSTSDAHRSTSPSRSSSSHHHHEKTKEHSKKHGSHRALSPPPSHPSMTSIPTTTAMVEGSGSPLLLSSSEDEGLDLCLSLGTGIDLGLSHDQNDDDDDNDNNEDTHGRALAFSPSLVSQSTATTTTTKGLDVVRLALKSKEQFGLFSEDDDDDDDDDDGDGERSRMNIKDISSIHPDWEQDEDEDEDGEEGSRKHRTGQQVLTSTKSTALQGRQEGVRSHKQEKKKKLLHVENREGGIGPENLMSVVKALRRERTVTAKQHKSEVLRLKHTIADLENKALGTVRELAARQAKIEEDAGLAGGSASGSGYVVQQARLAMQNLVISKEKYDELKSKLGGDTTEDNISFADTIRMKVFETVSKTRTELEAVRLDSAQLREENLRLKSDLHTVRREHSFSQQRLDSLTSESASQKSEFEMEKASINQELVKAKKDAEENKRKAQEFDKVAEELKNAQERNKEGIQRRSTLETEVDRLQSLVSELNASVSDKDHTVALISTDKKYLSTEIEKTHARCEKAEEEVEALRHKVTDLKKQRADLFDRVMLAHEDNKTHLNFDDRLSAEVSRIQSAAKEDIERIRVENLAAHHREVEVLKEMRDSSVNEVRRLSQELRDARSQYDDLLVRHREAQKEADVSHSSMVAECKMKSFESERMRILAEEAKSSSKQHQLENELLKEKVTVLGTSYHRLDAEMAKKIHELEAANEAMEAQLRHYEMLEKEIDEAVLAAGKYNTTTNSNDEKGHDITDVSRDDDATTTMSSATAATSLTNSIIHPISVKRRVQQSISLSRRCTSLEASLAAIKTELTKVTAERDEAEHELDKERRKLESIAKPHSFMARTVQELEEKISAGAHREKHLEKELQVAYDQRRLLQHDLEALVHDRSELINAQREMQAEMQAEIASAAAIAAAEAVAKASAPSPSSFSNRTSIPNPILSSAKSKTTFVPTRHSLTRRDNNNNSNSSNNQPPSSSSRLPLRRASAVGRMQGQGQGGLQQQQVIVS